MPSSFLLLRDRNKTASRVRVVFMPVTHVFVSAKPDSSDPTIVRPSDWNAGHVITIVPAEADLTQLWAFTGGLTTAGPVAANTDVANKLYVDTAPPAAHALSHENGGTDEIDVGGLSGLLADAQTPLAHAASHENGGGDEISVLGLSGLLADDQNPVNHAADHENGGGDEISVLGLSGLLADNQNPTAHATEHVDGTDDIQDATNAQKGLATAAQIILLEAIPTTYLALDCSNGPLTGDLGIGVTPATALHVGGAAATDIGTFDYGLNLNPVVKPVHPGMTAALAGAGPGNVDNGIHYYQVTFYTALGETNIQYKLAGPNATTVAGNGQVDLANIPVSADDRVTGRRIYRTLAGTSYWQGSFLLTDIADNTTTTYLDNTADAGLGATDNYWRENTTCTNIQYQGTTVIILSENNTIFGLDCGSTVAAGTATGGEHTLIGYLAGSSLTSSTKMVAIGESACGLTTTGTSGVAVGHLAAAKNVAGGGFVAIGRDAGVNPSSITGSTLVGYMAGRGVAGATNRENTLVGNQSGYSLITGGYRNSCLGMRSGYNITSGDYNLILGAYIQAPVITGSGQMNLGNLLYGTDLYQTAANSSTPVAGKIGVGVVPTVHTLEVAGDIQQALHTDNVSNPPTDAELDALFGAPATQIPGAKFLIDDAGGEANTYLIVCTGTKWQYLLMTTAV